MLWERKDITTVPKDPLIIRVTKLFLRITILLSIIMTIVTGIKFVTSMWEWWFSKNSKKLIPIVVWLLIALFSVVIIEILSSLPMSTLPN
jgi:heme/copper-type cytochrome/quinol oxidase subunit 1